jgi:hypothetical protein
MPKLESRLDVMLVKPLVIDRETFAESRSWELAFLGLRSALKGLGTYHFSDDVVCRPIRLRFAHCER